MYDAQAGTEFSAIMFTQGVWADFQFTREQPKRLHDFGVQPCRVMQGDTCPGGPWNFTCAFNHEGPLCGICDMGPDVMAPTHYRDKLALEHRACGYCAGADDGTALLWHFVHSCAMLPLSDQLNDRSAAGVLTGRACARLAGIPPARGLAFWALRRGRACL